MITSQYNSQTGHTEYLFEFEIRLSFTEDWKNQIEHYIDEMSEDELKTLELFSYDFVDLGILDLQIKTEFVNKRVKVTVLSPSHRFDEVICLKNSSRYYGYIPQTLLNFVKDDINGQLSDGVGENEQGHIKYKGEIYDVYFDELITEEPTNENNCYFDIKYLCSKEERKELDELYILYKKASENLDMRVSEIATKYYNDKIEELGKEFIHPKDRCWKGIEKCHVIKLGKHPRYLYQTANKMWDYYVIFRSEEGKFFDNFMPVEEFLKIKENDKTNNK
jgi:hypothetical protein